MDGHPRPVFGSARTEPRLQANSPSLGLAQWFDPNPTRPLPRTLTIHDFDSVDGRRVGEMLGRTGTTDVTDAHLVVAAASLGLDIVTGDPADIERLAGSLVHPQPTVRSWT